MRAKPEMGFDVRDHSVLSLLVGWCCAAAGVVIAVELRGQVAVVDPSGQLGGASWPRPGAGSRSPTAAGLGTRLWPGGRVDVTADLLRDRHPMGRPAKRTSMRVRSNGSKTNSMCSPTNAASTS